MSERWNLLQPLSWIGPLPHVQWPLTIALGIAVILAFMIGKWVIGTLRPKDFPPGPPVIPGLGNLHQMPIGKPYLKFHEWSEQYGDIIGLKTGTGNLVVLNTPEVVHEYFEKRGAICSNRPVNHIMTKHVLYEPEEKGLLILQYDEYYRRWRKSFQFILSAAGIKRLLPLLEAEASNLCKKFLDGGKDFEQRARHWALAVPVVAITGERLDDLPADYADKVCHAQEVMLELILPGAAPPVDIFPILKYVPEFLAKWKSRARYVRKCLVDDANSYLVSAQRTYQQLVQDPDSVGFDSLLPKIMKEQSASQEKEKFTNTELAFIGQGAIGAAVDTTLGTFKSLMLAFAAFPETLRKAQKEIDSLAGNEPLESEKLGELKYLKACLLEVLRWRPTAPQCLPHALSKDERIGQYFFPKGTVFIANAWTIQRNGKEYDRPNEFIPERFIDSPFGLSSSFKTDTDDLENRGRKVLYVFGAGRRQCPGEQFAMTSLLLAAAKIVWAYNILPPPGGLDMSVETGYKDGVITEPAHPEVVFELRADNKKAAVLADADRTGHIARQLLG
ncbi:putative Cytochrome P450 [Seiridium cardinale]|uniref:Cytochrome P450 n=1 Tax=Seiridium cardinale TaxID=138064 RepID=A0ABR2Y5K9_9PEZI